MKEENVIKAKSMDFAVRIVKLYRHLCESKKEFVLSRQILRSGTSIGANVNEAIFGQSKGDFISKLQISLKEASETAYWLELLYKTEYLTKSEYMSIHEDCGEITKILISIIKSSKENC